jgi:tetratricopeptide (TPR) repeat protein
MNIQHPLILLWLLPVIAGGSYAWTRVSASERNRFVFFAVAALSIVIALANPYWNTTPRLNTIKGAELVILMDVSQSMFCSYGEGRRIDYARKFVSSVITEFPSSPVAIIYFAGDASLGTPMTADTQAIRLFLESIVPAMSIKAGTLSGSLPDLLQEITREKQAQTKQIGLLLSDGEFSDSASALKTWLKDHPDFSLSTVVCGSGKAPVPRFDLSGAYPGAISEVQAKTLQEIASAGRGDFFDVTQSPASAAAKLAANVRELVVKGEEVPDYRMTTFALIAVVLLAIYQLFPLLRHVRPAPVSLMILMVTALAMKPEDSYKHALNDSKAKHYSEALQELNRLQNSTDSEEILVAIGNIHFLQDHFDDAIRCYKQALRKNPANRRARWNWEVALKRKSNPNPPPEKTPQPKPQEMPQNIPPPSKALLNYFDQLEKEQMQQENREHENTSTFAW